MARRRFLVSSDRIQDGLATLAADQAHHLRDVLRLGCGDEVELFDGCGAAYSGQVECCGDVVAVRILRKLEPEKLPKTGVILAAALIKPDRYEWLLEKATELGVERIIPLETRFTNIRTSKIDSRMARWRRIVEEAAKQCGRATIPCVQRPLPFLELLNSAEFAAGSRFILYEQASDRLQSLTVAGSSVLLCIGPEGGWEESEVRAAHQAGFRLIRMGTRILRAETAAIAAVAVFQFLLDE